MTVEGSVELRNDFKKGSVELRNEVKERVLGSGMTLKRVAPE